MLTDITTFCRYFESIRRRTVTYIRAVPSDRVDWAPAPGEYSVADLIRHLGAGEQMFVGAVARQEWHYAGHHGPPGVPLDTLLADLAAGHVQGLNILRSVPDSALHEPRPTLDGPPVPGWRLLLAMVEHEIHHRSQLAGYLTQMGVPAPHIFGLGVEDVIARATS